MMQFAAVSSTYHAILRDDWHQATDRAPGISHVLVLQEGAGPQADVKKLSLHRRDKKVNGSRA
jgi:hypothetical protein